MAPSWCRPSSARAESRWPHPGGADRYPCLERGGPIIDVLLAVFALGVLLIANAALVAGELALAVIEPARSVPESSHHPAPSSGSRPRLAPGGSSWTVGAAVWVLTGALAEPAVWGVLGAVWPGVDPARPVRLVTAVAVVGLLLVVPSELMAARLALTRPRGLVVLLARPLDRLAGLRRPRSGPGEQGVGSDGREPAGVSERLAVRVEASLEVGLLGPAEAQLVTRALRFGDTRVVEVMTPRPEVVAVDADAQLDEVRQRAASSGRSRLVVAREGDLDELVGVVEVGRLGGIGNRRWSELRAGDLARPAPLVPERLPVPRLLELLDAGGERLAIVLDEHGGTVGVVSREDVLEELVGPILDEHDLDEPSLRSLASGGGLLVDASSHRREVEELTGLLLPPGPYETIAGFVLSRLGRLGAVGDRVSEQGWLIEVVAVEGRRITSVLVEQGDQGR